MKVRDVVRLLEQNGWVLIRTRGSHHQFQHPAKPGTVTVPGNPNFDLHPKTLRSIMRQSGLQKEEGE